VAREFLTVRKPPSLSFRDAAALPMCFLSAFASLYRAVEAGDTVYIPGGGGGVGHLAVQMAARALGAGLVISSGSTPGRSHWRGSPAPITFSITSATTSRRKSGS
jgi:NADPH:quinone reductase-like Zn-dependent oxidoreductase